MIPRYLDVYSHYKHANDPHYTKGEKDHYPAKLSHYLFKKFKMQAGNKLLDVGCGAGEYLLEFKNLGLETYGIDRENNTLTSTLNIQSGFDFEKDKFPFKDNSFDFVFSKSVIAHLWNPNNYIEEIYKVLKPGGQVIITTPDWKSHMRIFYDDFTMVHPYTTISLKKMLQAYHFNNVESSIFYTKPIFWHYPSLKIIARLLQIFGPVKGIHKNQFIRWSRELMVLGSGVK